MGITYEEMRQFYSESEQREQNLIVMNQRLMIKLRKLEAENRELKKLTK